MTASLGRRATAARAARRRAPRRIFALLALGAVAGCSSSPAPKTRLDVHVLADASLGLKAVDLTLSAPTTRLSNLTAHLPLDAAAAGVVSAPVWEVLIPNASNDFMATVQAIGAATGSANVVASSDVIITAGRPTDVTLRLSLACRGRACGARETCDDGACKPRPTVGGGNGDGSVDTGAGESHDAGPSGDAAPAVDGPASTDSLPASDGASDVTADSVPVVDAGCEGGACTTKKAEGAPCATAGQCQSDACVEGVCCNGACAGGCNSCLKTYTGLADGMCAPVKIGVVHPGACSMDSATSCGLDGTCDGAGACRRWTGGTTCEAVSCSPDGLASVARATCDGAGVCVGGPRTSCGNYRCSTAGGQCLKFCGNSSDCSTTTFCDVGICKAKLDSHQACTSAEQCASAFCDMDPVGYCKNRVDLECDVPSYGCIANLIDTGPCVFSYSCR